MFAAPTNLTCLAVATLSTAPSTSLTVSKSFSPVTLFHWAFPQRLSELRVDVALPVLAEVDIRDCWVAYHPQSNSGERRTLYRRCSRPSPHLTVPPLLMEAM